MRFDSEGMPRIQMTRKRLGSRRSRRALLLAIVVFSLLNPAAAVAQDSPARKLGRAHLEAHVGDSFAVLYRLRGHVQGHQGLPMPRASGHNHMPTQRQPLPPTAVVALIVPCGERRRNGFDGLPELLHVPPDPPRLEQVGDGHYERLLFEAHDRLWRLG